MTRSVSESSLVSSIPSIPIESSQIVIHDEDENSNVLDVEEYCSNREVVNLENAAVNIDNSNDVIIGPVTQFNVNGNVTIYSNGNAPAEAINGTTTLNEEQQPDLHLANGVSKTQDLTIYCFRLLYFNKDLIRNVAIILAVFLLCLIILSIVVQNLNKEVDEHNYNYTEQYYGDCLGKHKIYYRADWGGECPKYNTKSLQHPVDLIIISHTFTLNCNSTEKCCSLLRGLQKKHFSLPIRTVDIGYNFLVGGEGNIYVGRGWDIQNFHRRISIGISFIGDFNFDSLNINMVEAAKELIKQGVELKKISEKYILVGENQTNSKAYSSPGKNIYKVIANWSHFYDHTML